MRKYSFNTVEMRRKAACTSLKRASTWGKLHWSIAMRTSLIFATALIAMSTTISNAAAHPGANILTAGANKERSAMTSGMTFEEVGAVHVFRGRRALIAAAPTATEIPARRNCNIKIILPESVLLPFLHLRTQGFYSGTGLTGNGLRSRRYTQGFYSGN
jgi:hypothetical protein